MAKYAYKIDYNNTIFISQIERQIGASVISMTDSMPGMVIVEPDNGSKADLDEYMNAHGFCYLFEITETLASYIDWGKFNAAQAPFTNVQKGDMAYCLDQSKPIWFDSTNWLDAAGNIVISAP